MHPAYFAREPNKKSFANPKTTCDYVVGQTQIGKIRFVANKLEDFCCFLKHLAISVQLPFCTAVR